MSDEKMSLEEFLTAVCRYWFVARRASADDAAERRRQDHAPREKVTVADGVIWTLWSRQSRIVSPPSEGAVTYYPTMRALRIQSHGLAEFLGVQKVRAFSQLFSDARPLPELLRAFVASQTYEAWSLGQTPTFTRLGHAMDDVLAQAAAEGVPDVTIGAFPSTLVYSYRMSEFWLAFRSLTVEQARVVDEWSTAIQPERQVIDARTARLGWLAAVDPDVSRELPSVDLGRLVEDLGVETEEDGCLTAEVLNAPAGARVLVDAMPDGVENNDFLIVSSRPFAEVKEALQHLPFGHPGSVWVLDPESIKDRLSQQPWVWSRHFAPDRGIRVEQSEHSAHFGEALGIPRLDLLGVEHPALAAWMIAPGGTVAIAGRPGSGKTIAAYHLLSRTKAPVVILNPDATPDDLQLAAAIGQSLAGNGRPLAFLLEDLERDAVTGNQRLRTVDDLRRQLARTHDMMPSLVVTYRSSEARLLQQYRLLLPNARVVSIDDAPYAFLYALAEQYVQAFAITVPLTRLRLDARGVTNVAPPVETLVQLVIEMNGTPATLVSYLSGFRNRELELDPLELEDVRRYWMAKYDAISLDATRSAERTVLRILAVLDRFSVPANTALVSAYFAAIDAGSDAVCDHAITALSHERWISLAATGAISSDDVRLAAPDAELFTPNAFDRFVADLLTVTKTQATFANVRPDFDSPYGLLTPAQREQARVLLRD